MQVVVRLSREIPTMEQIFMRNSFVLIVSAIIILRKKGSLFGPAKYQPYLFGRSFFGFLGLITLFYASSHAAQGDVTILNKTSPIWVTILAVIFMKEKLPKIQIPALALSMVGAFIVFRPSFESNPFPLVVAFLSAVTSGVAYTFLSFFKGKVDGLTVMMHFSTFSAIASIPFMLKDFVVPSFKQAVLLLLLGVFGSLGQAFGRAGFSTPPPFLPCCSPLTMLRFLGAAHVEAYRNVPLLVLLLAIYLVVTELLPGVRQAWHVGNWIYLSKTGLLYAAPLMGFKAVLCGLGVGLLGAWAGYKTALRRTTGLFAGLIGLAAFAVTYALVWVLCGVVGGWDVPVATRFSMRGGSQLTPEFLTIWLGLTMFTSAAIAEIVRAGVQAVRPGQWHAAYALGLTRGQTVSYVVFPQAMRLAIPPLASQYMNLTKNSSLAVMVGYPDIVNIGNTAINVSAQALEVIAIIMAVYLTINLVIAMIKIGRAHV